VRHQRALNLLVYLLEYDQVLPMLFCTPIHHNTFIPYNEVTCLKYLSILNVYVILHDGLTVICIFNSNFSTECAVPSPSRRVVVILYDVIVNCSNISWLYIVSKIIEMRNVLPVSLSASRKYNSPLLLEIQILHV